MKERAAELRKEQANKRSKKDPEEDVLERIASMDDQDSFLASKLHTLVRDVAPELGMNTWSGMPAYTMRPGKFCFILVMLVNLKRDIAPLILVMQRNWIKVAWCGPLALLWQSGRRQ